MLSATFSDCAFQHNIAIGGHGGAGGNGGDAWGGGLADLLVATLTVNDSTVANNLAIGGDGAIGGKGGNGLGGGLYEDVPPEMWMPPPKASLGPRTLGAGLLL